MSESFKKRYNTLNLAQREAVNNYEGPVMLVALAGTGKTEVLGMRVANMLLSESQINPENILAITFTEGGAVNMRERLISIIGTVAYKVNIYTFHGLCNYIIHTYGSLFGMDEYRPASELEENDILRQIIDSILPNNPLYRSRGDRFYEINRLKPLFRIMREEAWSAEDLELAGLGYLEDLKEREEYIYKKSGKGFKKGDLKQKLIDAEAKKIEQLIAGSKLFKAYMELMNEQKLYTFADMIGFVLKALKEDEYIAHVFQEKFQYLLIDESNDCNNSQMDLVRQLTNYWDRPNVFVVGDPDQTIMAFQGAQIRNMLRFSDEYSPEIIMMSENYRSNQKILDAANNVISNNTVRLTTKYPELNKPMTDALKKDPLAPEVWEFESEMEEEFYIAADIKKMIDKGVDPGSICVLYRKHKQVEGLISILKSMGIPVNMKRKINVLNEPAVKQVLDMLTYITLEATKYNSSSDLLFKLLQYRAFGIDNELVHRLWMESKYTLVKGEEAWIIAEDTSPDLKSFSKKLDKQIANYYDDKLFNRLSTLLYDFKIMQYWKTKKDGRYHMMVLNSFMEFVKAEVEKNPTLDEHGLIDLIDRMKSDKLSIPLLDVNFDFTGVNLSTVHGSKGLEWENVYVMGVLRSEWEKSRGTGSRTYLIPDTLTMSSASDSNEEDNRRLNYVALTRAKERLRVSYPTNKNTGEKLERSQFVDESGIKIIQKKTAKNRINKFLAERLVVHKEIKTDTALKLLYDEQFAEYRLSPSHLNTYLRCPVEFFYKNVLRVSEKPNSSLILGNSIHNGLEAAYKSGNYADAYAVAIQYMNSQLAFISENDVFPMSHAIDEILKGYYDTFKIPKGKMYPEFDMRNIVVNGVPLKGKIDRIDIKENRATVNDYKTGSLANIKKGLKPPSIKEPNGGDYWRQGKFYQVLIDEFQSMPWKVDKVVFEACTVDGTTLVPVDDLGHDELFISLITDVYNKIKNMEFDTGCNDPKCIWCNFKNNL